MRRVIATGLLFAPLAAAQVITTLAGTSWVFPNGSLSPTQAPLGRVRGVAIDSQGNIYLADPDNALVLKISTGGILSVYAGNGQAGHSGDNGPAVNASINPTDVAVDSGGDLYIQDGESIRMVTPSGTISTIAGTGIYTNGGSSPDGPATTVSINALAGMAFDKTGILYFADSDNDCIRKISNGAIVTVAGSCGTPGNTGDGGAATSALLSLPKGLAFDSTGSMLYISDTGNSRIRALTVSTGTINAVVGPTPFAAPTNLAIDSKNNLYISDTSSIFTNSNVVYQYNLTAKTAPVVYVGTVGPGAFSGLNTPLGLAFDGNGNLYIADSGNLRLQKVFSGAVSTVAGDGDFRYGGDKGEAINAQLNVPAGMALDKAGNLYFADSANNRVRTVSAAGVISTIAGTGQPKSGDNPNPLLASFNNPSGVALDPTGTYLYIADTGNGKVRQMVLTTGAVTTMAGGGNQQAENILATNASLLSPVGVAVDASGNVYVSDSSISCSKVYVVKNAASSSPSISTFVGQPFSSTSAGGCFGGNNNSSTPPDGPALQSAVNQPQGLAFDSSGNLYIADTGNNLVRIVSKGNISTIAHGLDRPSAVAVDALGDVYIAEGSVGRILEIPAGASSTQAIAGGGSPTVLGDGGSPTNAGLNQPQGIAVDSSGSVLIADSGNFRIRRIIGSAQASPAAPPPPAWTASPTTPLAFSQATPGAPVAPQTISLTPVANGATPQVNGLSFAASTDAGSVLWLSINPSSGNMPGVITVTATPGNLAAGTYNGTITITAPNTETPVETIPVSLTVPQPAPPAISVDVPNGISFTVSQNSSPASSQFHVSNTGSGTLSFSSTITCGGSAMWLSLSPSGGAATPGNPVTVTATATPGSLTPGVYTCPIVLAGAGSTVTVPATLTVNGPTAVMLVSESGMNFTAVSGGSAPLAHTFGILNTGSCPNNVSVCPMDWQATTSWYVNGALSANSWLSVSPSSGTVQQPYLDVDTVNVSVNPAGLSPATYYGRITITSNAALNSPVLITVTMTVLPSGTTLPPEIYPTGLIFTGVAGADPGSQDLTVGNAGSAPVTYSSQPLGSGFTFAPTNASVVNGSSTPIHVYPDFKSLSAGSSVRGGIAFLFADGTLETVSVLSVVAPSGTVAAGTADADSHARNLAPRATGCTPKSTQVVLRSPQASFTAFVGHAMNIEAQVTDSCGNAITSQTAGAQVYALFGDSSKLTMTSVGQGLWQTTWTPSAAGSALFDVVSSVDVNGLNVGGHLPSYITGSVSAAPPAAAPAPLTSSVQHAASQALGLPIAPGELISVYGQNLAAATFQASNSPFPTSAGSFQALLGLTALPILFTNSGQMNVQVPYSVPVGTTYQLSVVSGDALSVPQTLVVAAAVPGIFTTNEEGSGPGAIQHGDYSLVDQNNPASIGETVIIYCTGLGLLNNPDNDATINSEGTGPDTIANTVNTVTAMIGGVPASVSYAGVTPGAPGLYQVNVVVPQGIQTGDNVPVQISEAGQNSQAVTMSVH